MLEGLCWHKDDLGYKSLDLLMAVSDIDDLNGPFHAVKDKNKLGVLSKFDADIKNPVRGERSKIKLDDFEKFKRRRYYFIKRKKWFSNVY